VAALIPGVLPVTIEVQALSKRFGPVQAVDDLSFTVRPGRVTGFLGPNGAGKTTTMRLILGLETPSSGQAHVNGRRYAQLTRPLHQVGALLDANALHGGRTAWVHLLSLAQSNGISRGRVTETLRLTGLEPVARRRVNGYSLGMRQRLGIAAALLGDPGVLMFDEPVNGLDTEGIAWLRGLFKSLAAEGRTVLVSSHLMNEMALVADRLVVIGRGRLIADTTVDELILNRGSTYVRLKTPRAAEMAALLTAAGAAVRPDEGGDAMAVTGCEAAAIGDLAAAHGIAVHELTPRHASLEEVYLDVTGDSVDFHAGA
jgi:ABC-2 type transport system ATP-binding protein